MAIAKSPRKIAVITGTRAEYGLLKPLLAEIAKEQKLFLQLVVTGAHLEPAQGLTIQEIKKDGYQISAEVKLDLVDDSPEGIARSMATGLNGFAKVFSDLQPDLILILGDRYELLSIATAALLARIPIAHLHGGEATEGLIDEAIRHSLTKMSHLHFTAALPYRKRVIQLGENPKNVWNVGALAIDSIKKIKLLSRPELEKTIDFSLNGKPNILVTYHPVTLKKNRAESDIKTLLQSLDKFPQAKILFTKANADTDGSKINAAIAEYVDKNPQRAKLVDSLGQLRYLSAIAACDLVVGNSSSALFEAPALYKPAVNIGERQQGRLKPPAVISTLLNSKAIEGGIKKALSAAHKKNIKKGATFYGNGTCAKKIVAVLKKTNLDQLIVKQFHNLDF